jgi:hypothetical protein
MAGGNDTTGCGLLPATLLQLLAASLVTSSGTVYLNTIQVEGVCDGLTSAWECTDQGMDLEAFICANMFALDECGNMAVKVYKNTGVNGT